MTHIYWKSLPTIEQQDKLLGILPTIYDKWVRSVEAMFLVVQEENKFYSEVYMIDTPATDDNMGVYLKKHSNVLERYINKRMQSIRAITVTHIYHTLLKALSELLDKGPMDSPIKLPSWHVDNSHDLVSILAMFPGLCSNIKGELDSLSTLVQKCSVNWDIDSSEISMENGIGDYAELELLYKSYMSRIDSLAKEPVPITMLCHYNVDSDQLTKSYKCVINNLQMAYKIHSLCDRYSLQCLGYLDLYDDIIIMPSFRQKYILNVPDDQPLSLQFDLDDTPTWLDKLLE